MMAAPIHTSESSFDAGTPAALFQTRINLNPYKQQFAVSADGHFLINQLVEESPTSPITLILNWKPPTK